MLTLLAVSYVIIFLAAASLFYTAYSFLVVEGHSQDDDLPATVAAVVWASLAIEMLGVMCAIVSVLVLLRAGFLSWWPWTGLIPRWLERRRRRSQQ